MNNLDMYYLQLNTGQTSSAVAGFDVNVEPVWIQGITGCNSVVGIVDDGMYGIKPMLHHNIIIDDIIQCRCRVYSLRSGS